LKTNLFAGRLFKYLPKEIFPYICIMNNKKRNSRRKSREKIDGAMKDIASSIKRDNPHKKKDELVLKKRWSRSSKSIFFDADGNRVKITKSK